MKTKIQELYENEKSKGFVNHLIRAYLPVNKMFVDKSLLQLENFFLSHKQNNSNKILLRVSKKILTENQELGMTILT